MKLEHVIIIPMNNNWLNNILLEHGNCIFCNGCKESIKCELGIKQWLEQESEE